VECDASCSGLGPLAGYCARGNEPSVIIKGEKFLE